MDIRIKACVNCGECCLASPCGFGKLADNGKSCAYVVFDDNGRSSCSIASEIVKCPSSAVSPAFGSGCCRTLFNERRKEIIIRFYDGKEQYIKQE